MYNLYSGVNTSTRSLSHPIPILPPSETNQFSYPSQTQRYLFRISYLWRAHRRSSPPLKICFGKKLGHENHPLKLDYNLPHKRSSCPTYEALLIQSLYFMWWANKLQNKLVGLSHRDYDAIWLRSSRFKSGSFPQEIPPPVAGALGAGVPVAQDALAGQQALRPLHSRVHQVLHEGETCLECPCCLLHILFWNQVRLRKLKWAKLSRKRMKYWNGIWPDSTSLRVIWGSSTLEASSVALATITPSPESVLSRICFSAILLFLISRSLPADSA